MSSISSVGSCSAMTMMPMGRMQRPSASQMAEDMLSKVDTSGKGYIEKADLETAFSALASSDSSASVDEVFSTLDADSDGKLTEDELTSSFEKLEEELDSQFQQMRMGEAMGGMAGMPPPPPPADDEGFTEDELTTQLGEISSSDESGRADLISNILESFDEADADGNGRVSFAEARAFDESGRSASGASSSSGSTDTSAASASSSESSTAVMQQIMKLMAAYQGFGSDSASTRVSVTA